MANPFDAANDPLFFLHHRLYFVEYRNIDRIWYIWQHRAFENLTNDKMLDDVIDLHGLAPNVTFSQLLNTSNNLLCYSYSNSIKPDLELSSPISLGGLNLNAIRYIKEIDPIFLKSKTRDQIDIVRNIEQEYRNLTDKINSNNFTLILNISDVKRWTEQTTQDLDLELKLYNKIIEN